MPKAAEDVELAKKLWERTEDIIKEIIDLINAERTA